MRQPVDAVGRMAAEMLSRMIAGDSSVTREITVPTELIVRESLGRAANPQAKRQAAELTR